MHEQDIIMHIVDNHLWYLLFNTGFCAWPTVVPSKKEQKSHLEKKNISHKAGNTYLSLKYCLPNIAEGMFCKMKSKICIIFPFEHFILTSLLTLQNPNGWWALREYPPTTGSFPYSPFSPFLLESDHPGTEFYRIFLECSHTVDHFSSHWGFCSIPMSLSAKRRSSWLLAWLLLA
jgi:hypothetical protein